MDLRLTQSRNHDNSSFSLPADDVLRRFGQV